MLGVNLTSRDVKECNKRGCFHIHGQAQGGATPELIAFVAEDAVGWCLPLRPLLRQNAGDPPFSLQIRSIPPSN